MTFRPNDFAGACGCIGGDVIDGELGSSARGALDACGLVSEGHFWVILVILLIFWVICFCFGLTLLC